MAVLRPIAHAHSGCHTLTVPSAPYLQVPALPSLSDGMWPGTVGHTAFGQGVCPSNGRENGTLGLRRFLWLLMTLHVGPEGPASYVS